MAEATCTVEGCERSVEARGWCQMHYARWRRHGDPLGARRPKPLPDGIDQRFWAKVDVGHPLGCWEWTAATNASGYGALGRHGDGTFHHFLAHRYAYEQLVGPVPTGMGLDHLCRNRSCVNPDHLEPVTPAENVRRGASPSTIAARKDVCRHGHQFTAGNTYTYTRGNVTYRKCRRCTLDAQARYIARKRRAG